MVFFTRSETLSMSIEAAQSYAQPSKPSPPRVKLYFTSATERASSDALEKDPATGDTARKELTPLEETFEQAKLTGTGKK
jgi:hypothetical protein